MKIGSLRDAQQRTLGSSGSHVSSAIRQAEVSERAGEDGIPASRLVASAAEPPVSCDRSLLCHRKLAEPRSMTVEEGSLQT